MRVGIISDSHFGARGNHQGFLEYFERFYAEIFFPTLERNGISKIIHLGDLVDNRNSLNHYVANRMGNSFIKRLTAYNVDFIVGNHDTYHKNTNEINAYDLIKAYPNIKVHEHPVVHNYYGHHVLFLPWINQSNQADALELLENVKLDLCFGHLHIQGFEMQSGSIAMEGLSSKLFTNFSHVFTGHFHHKSSRNNIHYLGAPYEWRWSDYNDPRGFHIFDFETKELEFIQNPYTMFHMIHYHDDMPKQDLSFYSKKYLKILVKNLPNEIMLENWLDELEMAGPASIQIIRDSSYIANSSALDTVSSPQDTLSILRTSVDEMPDTVDKAFLKQLFETLHNEANTVEA